jgi:aspartate aminotransferase
MLSRQALCFPELPRSTNTMTTTYKTLTQTAESWFDQADYIPPDAIFALTAQYVADSSPNKVNLGQGTYRDDKGKPWVLPSVRRARERLMGQDLNHEYLPILGLLEFRERAAELALGSKIFAGQKDNVRDGTKGTYFEVLS